MKAQRELERKEEAERDRIRQEKRAAKEKRREEARHREAEVRKESDMKMSHEMQMNGNGTGGGYNRNGNKNNISTDNGYNHVSEARGRTCLGSVIMFLLGLGVAGMGLAISLLWIYTEGKMDSKSVQSALPVIQADVEDVLMTAGKNTVKMYEQAEKISRPYLESAIKNGKSAWNEGGKQLRDGAKYVEDNYGDVINDGWNQVKSMAQFLRDQIVLAWKKILPHLKDAWEASKPFFHQLGKFIIEKSLEVWNYLQTNFPVYMEMLSQTTADLVQFTAQCWQKITEAF